VERARWGFTAAGIARRLARRWRLPAWLADVVSHLGLPAETAQGLGTDPLLLRSVQLAVALVEKAHGGLHLEVGSPADTLAKELGLTADDLSEIHHSSHAVHSPAHWQPPASMPLLRDLLALAAENRRLADSPVLERLECDVDQLQRALGEQRASETRRLLAQKLNTLAEFAAGAGHEINNPLAVISGQAQYLLVHEADPDRQKSLQKIIGQTQRVHEILTELMQFARPGKPQKQRVNLGSLIREVAITLGDLAGQRQVRLVCPEPEPPVAVHADPRQVRNALTSLLRNAIEAAPPEGWAGVQVHALAADVVELWVEDSGSGLTPAQRENMFDPFYSGRQAGRGRGLGLPTAWRLARENGGDVVYCDRTERPTRFVLSLPRVPEPMAAAHTNGNGHHPSASPPLLPEPTNGHVNENSTAPTPVAES
jgi:signal transduction histidine kinase